MEQIRTRDDDSSPDPAPLIQVDPSLLTPNRREFDPEYPAWPSSSPSAESSDKSRFSSLQSLHLKLADLRLEPPRSKPLFRGFETPSFTRIAILTILCFITYPAACILEILASDRSLFVVRSIVAVWCSAFGISLGYVLLKIGARHIEAATWATVIHMSHEGGGMKLRDLARGSSNSSFLPAFHVFRSRLGNPATSRRSRGSYDKRPWSLFLVFFIILAILASALNFLFGRIIVINTFVSNQRKVYHEVLIAGDLSEADNHHAADIIDRQSAWSAFPYDHSVSDIAEFIYGNDTVYFAKPSLSQFLPGGYGAGVLNQFPSISLKEAPSNALPLTGRNVPRRNTGMILRYPQWGISRHCEKLPDPQVNLVPKSSLNFTYVFVPQDFLRGLVSVYGMNPPGPGGGNIFGGDTITSNVNLSTISFSVAGEDNGEIVSIYGAPYREDDYEWAIIEVVLIRMKTVHNPNGRYPVYHEQETGDRVGYDAAVCVQKYKPWVIEAYNTSATSPSILGIVEKGNGNTLSPSGNIRGPRIDNTRYLNSSGKATSFRVAQEYNLSQMLRTNGNSQFYFRSPSVVSFTNGTGLEGYTELDPERLAIFCARVSAANALPYLVGSGPLVAQSYADETLAYTAYKPWQLIGLSILIWTLGIIGELFVPKLPLNIPRREFGVYSWLALFQSQELQFEAARGLDKLRSLDELEEVFSDERVKFVA